MLELKHMDWPQRPAPAARPGEFVFSVAGMDHGHIYGMAASLAAAGAILASVWTPNNIPTVDGLGEEFLSFVKDGMTVEIGENGKVTVRD